MESGTKELIKYILADFHEVEHFIPVSIMIGTCCAGLFVLIRRTFKKTAAVWLFACYTVFLLCVTLFKREPGSITEGYFLWEILGTWFGGMHGRAYVIENFLIFIPFGFLCGIVLTRRRWMAVFLALGLSVFIEYLQLRLQWGHSELNDIIQNMAGGIVG